MDFVQKLKDMESQIKQFNKSELSVLSEQSQNELYEEVNQIRSAYHVLIDHQKEMNQLQLDLDKAENNKKNIINLAKLSPKDIKEIESIIIEYKEVKEERKELQKELESYDESLDQFSKHVDEIKEKMKDMMTASMDRKNIELKISQLQQKFEEREDVREDSNNRQQFIYGFTIFFIFLLTVGIGSLFILMGIYKKDLVLLSGKLAILSMIIAAFLVSVQRKAVLEYKKAGLELQEIAKRLKNEKIKLVHKVRFLQFQYQKYGVGDIFTLEKMMFEYQQREKKRERYQTYQKEIRHLENSMLEVLKHVEITDLNFIEKDFNEIFDFEKRIAWTLEYDATIDRIKNQIQVLNEEKKVVEEFLDTSIKDYSRNPILRKMVETYENELQDVKMYLDN